MIHRPVTVLASALLLGACSVDLSGVEVAAPNDDEAARAIDGAGCEVRPISSDGNRQHLDPAGAPSPAELYDRRPPTSGPHFAEFLEPGVYDGPIDERAAVHNLEHGAVVAWYDPSWSDEQVDELRTWAVTRNADGLERVGTGAGIIVAPFDEAPMDAPLALRAWEVAGDCEVFDLAAADAFLRDHFGPQGQAPERHLAPDPSTVLGRSRDA